MPINDKGFALVLSGGGARAASRVGLLRCPSRNFPDLTIPITTAGVMNAVFLANHESSFAEAVEEWSELWFYLPTE